MSDERQDLAKRRKATNAKVAPQGYPNDLCEYINCQVPHARLGITA